MVQNEIIICRFNIRRLKLSFPIQRVQYMACIVIHEIQCLIGFKRSIIALLSLCNAAYKEKP